MRSQGIRIGRLLISFALLGSASIQDASAGARETWEIHPPIGVFGETVHAPGDFKISYRVQRESFEGLMDGGNSLSQLGAMAAYSGGSIPTSLRSTSHVVELVWKPGDDWILLVTLPFIDRQVDQIDVTTGQGYSLAVSGFGDVVFSTLYKVYDSNGQRIHLNLGLSLPSGSSNEALATPFSSGTLQKLPYAMQLGSGTLALKPGVTYNRSWTTVYWGAQMTGTLQAGTNWG
ncbi:MAG TPA: hypothetical protein EYG46_18950 [Myxococcales bacterium]|nr:hypothetical protein [Myxococcales bacterium]HIM03059.1 hypothetical protein [Myxococcales bacterium]